jgi:hypothetical protein
MSSSFSRSTFGNTNAAATTILTKEELARMRNSILPSTMNQNRDTKNLKLKQLSTERVKNWPNTLEALRKKKESYTKEREELEEMKRQEIDRQEAELRRKTRLDAIDRANNMIYEQTDRMKYLRSQELLSDVIYSRGYQLQEKVVKKGIEQQQEDHFHQETLLQIQQNEQKEKEKLDKQRKKMNEVSVSRKEQLRLVQQARAKELEDERLIGEELKKEAIRQAELEQQQKIQKQSQIHENNLKMIQANEELKLIREEYLRLEALEDQKRLKEVDVIENRKLVRKGLEIRKFEKAQTKRQEIINAATKALEAKSNRDEQRLERQVNELKEREDNKEMNKVLKQENDWKKIMRSREEQMEERRRRSELERSEEERLIASMQLEKEENEVKEKEKMMKSKRLVKEIKTSQLAMSQQKAAEREERKVIERMKEKMIENELVEDDEKFQKICLSEIERYKADGKPVLPLYRALEHKPPEIMAVSGFRI